MPEKKLGDNSKKNIGKKQASCSNLEFLKEPYRPGKKNLMKDCRGNEKKKGTGGKIPKTSSGTKKKKYRSSSL
jgi:hypothetical protein